MGHIFLRQKKWPTHTQETKDNGRKERNLMTRQVKILLPNKTSRFTK